MGQPGPCRLDQVPQIIDQLRRSRVVLRWAGRRGQPVVLCSLPGHAQTLIDNPPKSSSLRRYGWFIESAAPRGHSVFPTGKPKTRLDLTRRLVPLVSGTLTCPASLSTEY